VAEVHAQPILSNFFSTGGGIASFAPATMSKNSVELKLPPTAENLRCFAADRFGLGETENFSKKREVPVIHNSSTAFVGALPQPYLLEPVR
jgi:hypothetical protein